MRGSERTTQNTGATPAKAHCANRDKNKTRPPFGQPKELSKAAKEYRQKMEEYQANQATDAVEASEAQTADQAKTENKIADTTKLTKKIKRSERSVKSYQFFLLRALIFILIIWVLFFQIVGLTHMPNEDMYPRVDAGDLVLFYRLEQNFKAQDIVVFEKSTPDNPQKQLFICRVVAVAGDTVQITDSERLVVNGNTMIEPNIFYSTPRYEGFTEYPLTLNEGEVFVLADSRNGGNDSRYFGPVQTSEILGTVITIMRRMNL